VKERLLSFEGKIKVSGELLSMCFAAPSFLFDFSYFYD
jgi:hypothetical protein